MIVYLAVFVVFLFIGYRILSNIKVVIIIAIAGFFAFLASNYFLNDKDLSDSNLLKQSEKFAEKSESFYNKYKKWEKAMDDDIANDNMIDWPEYKAKVRAEREASAKQDEIAKKQQEAKKKRYDALRDELNEFQHRE